MQVLLLLLLQVQLLLLLLGIAMPCRCRLQAECGPLGVTAPHIITSTITLGDHHPAAAVVPAGRPAGVLHCCCPTLHTHLLLLVLQLLPAAPQATLLLWMLLLLVVATEAPPCCSCCCCYNRLLLLLQAHPIPLLSPCCCCWQIRQCIITCSVHLWDDCRCCCCGRHAAARYPHSLGPLSTTASGQRSLMVLLLSSCELQEISQSTTRRLLLQCMLLH